MIAAEQDLAPVQSFERGLGLLGSFALATVGLVPLAASQRALIGQLDRERAGRLIGAMDACNARFGRRGVVPARAELAKQRRTWTTTFEMRTPRSTMQVDAFADSPGLTCRLAIPVEHWIRRAAIHAADPKRIFRP